MIPFRPDADIARIEGGYQLRSRLWLNRSYLSPALIGSHVNCRGHTRDMSNGHGCSREPQAQRQRHYDFRGLRSWLSISIFDAGSYRTKTRNGVDLRAAALLFVAKKWLTAIKHNVGSVAE